MPNLTVVVDKGIKLHGEYMRASKETVSALGPRNAQVWRMSKPESVKVKVNCDASWCRQINMGGIGVIERNVDSHVT